MSIEDQITIAIRREREVGHKPEHLKFNNNTYNQLKREVSRWATLYFKGDEAPITPSYRGLKIRIDNALLDDEVEVY